jgi:hypothetical protein
MTYNEKFLEGQLREEQAILKRAVDHMLMDLSKRQVAKKLWIDIFKLESILSS